MEIRIVVHERGQDSWSVIRRGDASFWVEHATSPAIDQPLVIKTVSVEWFCLTCLDESLSDHVLSGVDKVIAMANARHPRVSGSHNRRRWRSSNPNAKLAALWVRQKTGVLAGRIVRFNPISRLTSSPGQRPLPDGVLKMVATGEKVDAV